MNITLGEAAPPIVGFAVMIGDQAKLGFLYIPTYLYGFGGRVKSGGKHFDNMVTGGAKLNHQ